MASVGKEYQSATCHLLIHWTLAYWHIRASNKLCCTKVNWAKVVEIGKLYVNKVIASIQLNHLNRVY